MAKKKKDNTSKPKFNRADYEKRLAQKTKDIQSGKRKASCIGIPSVSSLVEEAVAKILAAKEKTTDTSDSE